MFKKHRNDAGFDICCAEDIVIPAAPKKLEVNTGLYVAIPPGCVGEIWPRSGLSIDFGTQTGAGIVDANYRGEIKVSIYTLEEPLELKAGSRIAQLVVTQLAPFPAIRVASLAELGDTDRGSNGFGSTGGY